MGQASVGKDRTATFRAAHPQQLGVAEMVTAPQLRDTLLLRPVNRQQALKDLGITRTRILFFDQPDQGPQRGLPIVLSRKSLATQSIPKTLTEPELRFSGDVLTIQIVVAIGIQKAVSQDGWCNSHALAEQRLQSASSPCIAACLNNIGHAQAWVELPRPPCQPGTHR